MSRRQSWSIRYCAGRTAQPVPACRHGQCSAEAGIVPRNGVFLYGSRNRAAGLHKFNALAPLLLAAIVIASVPMISAGPAHAGSSSSGALYLRGSLHPAKTHSRPVAVKLASLSASVPASSRPKSRAVRRLDFSSFRFSTKPSPDKPDDVKLASLQPLVLPKRIRVPSFRARARGFIKWRAYPGCVPRKLRKILAKVADRFGNVTVNSTHRNEQHNKEVGGAKHSYHLKCQAIDFRIKKNYRAAKAYLTRQAAVGGLKHYGGGLFHIDTGPRRSW